MNDRPKQDRTKLAAGAPRRSRSFLLRMWHEPRETAEQSDEVRGYLRDLQTGDEHYVAAPGSLAELLERFVAEAERSERDERAAEEEPRSESA